jgi:IS5 family transposase
MLRTINPHASLWESILPDVALRTPAELESVGRLLDDPVFLEPYRAHFDPIWRRPSTPIETYLRMMFLKYRYRLGYESLFREVSDSIAWMRFCRIPFGAPVPHPTTLMKITTRCGEGVVEALRCGGTRRDRRPIRPSFVARDPTIVSDGMAFHIGRARMSGSIQR